MLERQSPSVISLSVSLGNHTNTTKGIALAWIVWIRENT